MASAWSGRAGIQVRNVARFTVACTTSLSPPASRARMANSASASSGRPMNAVALATMACARKRPPAHPDRRPGKPLRQREVTQVRRTIGGGDQQIRVRFQIGVDHEHGPAQVNDRGIRTCRPSDDQHPDLPPSLRLINISATRPPAAIEASPACRGGRRGCWCGGLRGAARLEPGVSAVMLGGATARA